MLAEQFLYMFTSDVSELEKGEKKAQKENDNLQKGLQKTDDIANKMGNSFTDLIATAGGALTALLSFSALSAGISETSEYVDNLSKVSERLGENINDMGAWQEVVKKSGGDIGSFQGTLKGFTSQLNDLAVKGQNEMLPFLQKLGINYKNSEGKIKSALTLFPEIAESFEKLSKTESAGIGQKLGFDEGTISLLQMGRSEVEKQINAQKKLFTITKEQAKVFEDYNDSIDDTKTAFRGMFVELGVDIVPILQYFMEKLQVGIEFLQKNKELVTGVFIGLGVALTAYALPAIIKFGVATAVAFAPYYAIGAVIAGLVLLVAILYDEITAFLEGGNSAFEDFLVWLGLTGDEIEALRQGFRDFGDSVANIFDFLGSILKGFLQIAVKIAMGVFEAFKPLLWIFGKGIVGAIELAISGIKKVADLAKKVMDFFGIGGEETDVDVNKNVNVLNDDLEANLSKEVNLKTEQEPKQKQELESKQEPKPKQELEHKYYSETPYVEVDANTTLSNSAQNPINQMTPNMISNQNTNSANTNNIKIDKIEVQTQATDADGIASAFNDSLTSQLKKSTATFENSIKG